jgi:hypothetical protein
MKSQKEVIKKAGYYVSVTSWENDGDNYKTKDVHFDDLEKAKFALEICKKFKSSGRGGFIDDELGNTQFFRDGHLEMYHEALEKHIKSLFLKYNVPEEFGEREYVEYEIIDELIDSWGDGEMMRVFESGKIVYYPKDVVAEVITIEG